MARKSRKDLIRAANSGQTLPEQPQPQTTEIIYNTVGYARLSVLETRDRKDNEALQNQKALLQEFIRSQKDLKLLSLYEDNGETGTNFHRPGFESMMEAIYAGKANCIVVKDLSRFGRDYIEAGNFLDNVFPAMGVRFISIGDGYDSADATTADCLVVALKNLMNQMYSKDISRKSGSVLREKIQRGEFIGAYAAYGYIKDPLDKHRIIVDPEAAAGRSFTPGYQTGSCRSQNGLLWRIPTRLLSARRILTQCRPFVRRKTGNITPVLGNMTTWARVKIF